MNKRKKFQPHNQNTAYAFIMPSMIILTIFVFIPLISSFIISLLNMNIFMKDISFAGLDNFKSLFADERVFNATSNTIIFSLFQVPLQIGIALLLSMCLAKNSKYTKILRSVYYLPFVCSMTAISIVWSMLLDPNLGIIPYWLKNLGLESVAFLKDPNSAMPTVIVITAWKGFGYTLTLIMAAMLEYFSVFIRSC